jgi:squalene-hopene/tetraprenyl-beta-curcumene cyclase
MKTDRRAAAALLLAVAAVAAAAPARAQERPAPPAAPPASPAAPPAATAAPSKEARLAALDRGLAWLRGKAEAGKWTVQGKPEPGVTALALSALLSRPGGVAKEDHAVVEAGLEWLLSLEKEDGGIYIDRNANYTTSLALDALARSPRHRGLPAVARAVAFLRTLQFHEEAPESRKAAKGDSRHGGIGYGSDPTQPDLSNTQFALESLRAAGVPASDPAVQRAVVFLQRTQNRKENETADEPREWKDPAGGAPLVRSNDGGANYRPGDSKAGVVARPDGKKELRSYGSMTYALVKCYLFAGIGADDPRVKDAAAWIRRHYTWEENPGFADAAGGQMGLYYYYATAARTLAMLGEGAAGNDAGGKPRDWRGDLAGKLLSVQKADGSFANASDRWMEGLPEIATAFALKALAETVE